MKLQMVLVMLLPEPAPAAPTPTPFSPPPAATAPPIVSALIVEDWLALRSISWLVPRGALALTCEPAIHALTASGRLAEPIVFWAAEKPTVTAAPFSSPAPTAKPTPPALAVIEEVSALASTTGPSLAATLGAASMYASTSSRIVFAESAPATATATPVPELDAER